MALARSLILSDNYCRRGAEFNNENTRKTLESDEYFEILRSCGKELQSLTEKVWKTEYLNV